MSKTLTSEQVILLCDCFQRIDSNRDGSIDVSELDTFLKQSFPDADDETLVQVRNIVIVEGDSNADGRIDINEFITLISQRQYEAVLSALEGQTVEEPTNQEPADEGDPRIQSILANLEPREIDVLRDAFIKLDTDGDGYLSRVELRRGVEIRLKERFTTSWPYLEKIFDVADRDRDDRLSIFEFLSSFADGPGVVPHEIIAECVENVKIRLSDAELESLRDRFFEIDKNKDNFIDREELFAALKDVLAPKYPNMSDPEFEDIVNAVLAAADADQDGKLNLSEFIRSYQEDQGVLPAVFMGRAAAIKRKLTREEVEKLKAAFGELDSNADGFVDYPELYSAVSQTLKASGISEADTAVLVDTIMLTADRNGDGKLSMTEFIRSFVNNEEIMAIPVEAAEQRRIAAKERIEEIVDSGDLYKMVKLFTYLDANQDGFLERDEIFNILFRTLSQWYPTWTDDQKYKAIDTIIEGADVDGDGKISIDEFVHSYVAGYGILPVEVVREIAAHLRRQLSTEELQIVHDSFTMMDQNGDGFVTNEELRTSLAEALGPVATPEQINDITIFIMSKVDTDRDGRISLKEFIASCELDQDLLPVTDTPRTVEAATVDATPQAMPVDEPKPAAVATPLPEVAPAAAPPNASSEPISAVPVAEAAIVAVHATPSPQKVSRIDTNDARSPIVNDVSGALITDGQLRDQFREFDTDGSGKLNKAEFKKKFLALEWCGLTPSDSDFEKLFRRLCGKDNEVSYEEFCLFMLQRSRM